MNSRECVWHLKGIIRRLLEEVVHQTIIRKPGDNAWHVDKAILVPFKYGESSFHILLYAPTNYVGVLIREGYKAKFTTAGWEVKGYHDSCWVQALDTVLFEILNDVTGIQWIHGYEVVELSPDEQELLRRLLRRAVA